MNSEQFVSVIKQVVVDAAVNDMETALTQPPGRRPSKEISDLSAWYNSLDESNKKMIHSVISRTARNTAFGFLCVLDGVRSDRKSVV